MGIRKELDARRQIKTDVASAAAHKETMLGLLRASADRLGDSPEQKERRRWIAGDPEAKPRHSDGTPMAPRKTKND
jgi:hypothetical protein